MSEPNPGPLPPALAALVDAERRRPQPPASATERLLARLATAAATAAPTSVAFGVSWWVATLIGFTLGLPTGAWLFARFAPEPKPLAPEIVYLPAPGAVPSRAAPSPAPVSAPATPTKKPTIEQPAPRARTVDPGSLEAERQLLEAAREALTRGNAAAALGHLERHYREHPNGALSEEREALWVQALVSAGEVDAAHDHAHAFRLAHPQSLLMPLVDAASPP